MGSSSMGGVAATLAEMRLIELTDVSGVTRLTAGFEENVMKLQIKNFMFNFILRGYARQPTAFFCFANSHYD